MLQSLGSALSYRTLCISVHHHLTFHKATKSQISDHHTEVHCSFQFPYEEESSMFFFQGAIYELGFFKLGRTGRIRFSPFFILCSF